MLFTTRRPTAAAAAASTRRHQNRRAFRAGVEAMEGRQLMTAVPTFMSLASGPQTMQNTKIDPANFAPMENTNIYGSMGTAGQDNFRVYMNAGQIDDVGMDVLSMMSSTVNFQGHQYSITTPQTKLQATIQVADPSGKSIATSTQAGKDPEVVFQAPTTGWYTITLGTAKSANLPNPFGFGDLTGPATLQSATYTTTVRPIGLDPAGDSSLDPNHKAADAAKLNFSGGALYAYLSGRTATGTPGGVSTGGTALNFVGPTGRGFTVDGTWAESRAKNGDTIYTGTNLKLEVADPLHAGKILLVPLPLMGLNLSVDVAPDASSDSQGLFGAVNSTNFAVAGMPLGGSGGLISTLAGEMGASTTLSQAGFGASLPGLTWGVALGSDASAKANNLPANAAVPYIYFGAAAGGASLSFGSISASIGKGVSFSVLVDPADPSFEMDLSGVPIVSDVAIGVSANELIPYVPNTGGIGGSTLYGDLFLRGTLDVAALSGDVAPIDLSGDITLALDPMHLGLSKISSTLIPDLKTMTSKKAMQAISNANQFVNDMKQISLGVNGTVSLTLSAGSQVSFSMPAATASLEWNGMSKMLYFAGSTADPLKGTVLSSLTQDNQVYVHGWANINDSSFDVQAGVSVGYGSMVLAGGSVDISKGATGPVKLHLHANYVLAVATSYSQTINLLVTSYTLTASAAVNGSGNFDVTLDSNGNETMDITNNFTASASVNGLSISTTVTPTNLHYSGNVLAPIDAQLAGLNLSAKNKAMLEAILVITKYLG